MAWLSLIAAGLFEVVGVLGMNRVKRDNNLKAYLTLIIGYGVSFILLSLTLRSLPMGTAYAIWTGIGTSGGALVGMLFFGESKDWRRILFIFMIFGATIGLKLIS
ncbi:DMT family transporter [Paenibacillus terrae]|uniref:DMT family transporter n=1 Tax=Paenibacillus terrae TaxID=159743 RepID=UPI0011EAEBDD|nr:multidrug efflux SMR transporter [Paenibacillus terrae]